MFLKKKIKEIRVSVKITYLCLRSGAPENEELPIIRDVLLGKRKILLNFYFTDAHALNFFRIISSIIPEISWSSRKLVM